jgi:dTDP-4-dehydrorhamnose reductase
MGFKVLILGATGVLGFELATQVSKFSEIDLTVSARSVVDLGKAINSFSTKIIEFNVEDFMKNPNFYNLDNFDVIVNAIGAIKQKNIKDDDMFQINSYFPMKLAETVKTSTRIIHFTTDCVFSGIDDRLKNESTMHDAEDIYGKSKSAGEVHKRNVTNFRSSFVGMELNQSYSLLGWFLNLEENSIISGYTNQFWNGITSHSYSRIIGKFIDSIREDKISGNDMGGGQIPSHPIIHIVPRDYVSKYELLEMFKETTDRKDIIIQPRASEVAVNRVLSTNNNAFNVSLWNSAGYAEVPTIQELVKSMATEYRARKLQ